MRRCCKALGSKAALLPSSPSPRCAHRPEVPALLTGPIKVSPGPGTSCFSKSTPTGPWQNADPSPSPTSERPPLPRLCVEPAAALMGCGRSLRHLVPGPTVSRMASVQGGTGSRVGSRGHQSLGPRQGDREGSPSVGKIVMAAAAKHLTPVTLELGGKNPCYVDDDCDPQTVANRVTWFRYFNAGQTCVAPDYVLCSPETRERLLPALQNAITRFYGDDPQSSPNLGRIISQKHFKRLQGLLGCGRVAIGGQSDESELYIAPTVLVDVQETEPVMQEEIFGPILPLVTVRSLDEAIDFINRREKPLALYAFSNSSQVLEGTSSGSFGGNEGFIYMTLPSLPLGGVGHSGMGRYHGKFSFDTFSHHRACLLAPSGLERPNGIRYPPYGVARHSHSTS
uniref:Aldehyde dehydrogenase 3 family member B2 n=1 Tax=Marmota marmota marmota TaxID=9994 RepID=A0A8C5YKH6_MARMA